MNAASRNVRMTAGPATSIAAADPRSSPVPIEPPTATIAIWPAVSCRCNPCSRDAGVPVCTRDVYHCDAGAISCGARLANLFPRCVGFVRRHLAADRVGLGAKILLADDAIVVDEESHDAGDVVLRRPGDEREPARGRQDLEVVAME